jgi:3-hydroxyisobutyrate dehydrogenase-like beta-hydroxyacid dehydrogenase
MGAAMCARLVGAGHRVRVWNRTRSRAESVRDAVGADGLVVADTPSECVGGAEVVLSMLANGGATAATLLDRDLVEALGPETVVCDMGTSGVDAARSIARAYAAAHRRFVDAPVSGSVATVAAGQLLVMAAGAEEDVESVTPVLSAFAARIVRVGDAGQGQAMKLAVNLVVHDLNSAVSEALVLAEGAGIDPATAYEVLENSAVGAPFVRYKRAAFLEADQPVAMSLALVAKDLGLIADLAAAQGREVPVTRATRGVVDAAVAAGHGPQDMADLRVYLATRDTVEE